MEDGKMRLDLLAYNGTVINMGYAILIDPAWQTVQAYLAKAEGYAKAHNCQAWVISIWTFPNDFSENETVEETQEDDQVEFYIEYLTNKNLPARLVCSCETAGACCSQQMLMSALLSAKSSICSMIVSASK